MNVHIVLLEYIAAAYVSFERRDWQDISKAIVFITILDRTVCMEQRTFLDLK